MENFFHFRRSLLSFVPDNDQLNTLQNLGQVFTQKKGTQLEGYFAKPTRTNLEQEMALQSAGPQNNKEKFLPWSVQDFTLAVIQDARALSIPAPTPEERPCKVVVVVVVLLVIDQQRLCNGQEIMRTTTKVKLGIHKSHRGCCSFAAWEGWGHTGRQDRHYHEARDGGMGSYGDKRARERERERQTYR